MKTKTQNQRLLAYLKKHRKGITTLEAVLELGILRLSERIREIKNVGVPDEKTGWRICWSIDKASETSSNGATVTRYKLAR